MQSFRACDAKELIRWCSRGIYSPLRDKRTAFARGRPRPCSRCTCASGGQTLSVCVKTPRCLFLNRWSQTKLLKPGPTWRFDWKRLFRKLFLHEISDQVLTPISSICPLVMRWRQEVCVPLGSVPRILSHPHRDTCWIYFHKLLLGKILSLAKIVTSWNDSHRAVPADSAVMAVWPAHSPQKLSARSPGEGRRLSLFLPVPPARRDDGQLLFLWLFYIPMKY